ncbi:MAG: cytochrome c oxidase assembly protein [Proteobacteria bacterium]|nr:cytochrome c oxidase assembly protein [Pseudomonadota bacterium]
MTQPATSKRKVKRDVVIAATCGVVAAAMVGAAFASVPLYNWFCRTTGFGGTPQVAESGPGQVLDRTLTIRFDSNVAPGLPWRFVPEQNTVQVRIGEVKTVYYKVINMAARSITAQAGYNVTPTTVGLYFHKINCFCFTEQTMKPGETRDMAVVFYVDPSIVKDGDQDPLNTITLSYTFFPVDAPQKPVADAETKASKKL